MAEDLDARAVVMTDVRRLLHGLTVSEAAKQLGVSHQRIRDLMHGRIDLFTVDALQHMRDNTDLP